MRAQRAVRNSSISSSSRALIAQSPRPNVSVIVPTKNEGTVIESCLFSVFNQSVQPSEVIVVDGHSTDNTLEKAEKYPITIILENEPTSLPNARNLGAQQANGEVLLLLDADMILDRDCLKNALEYFTDPDVIAVVPDVKVSEHTRLEKIYGRWLEATESSIRLPNTNFIRKEVFKSIKYDRNLGFGEDDDFQIRLRQSYGKSKIVLAHDCKITMHLPHSVKELWQQHTWYGRTFLRYFLKNHGIRQILALASLLLPMFTLIFAGLALVSQCFAFLAIIGLAFLAAKSLVVCYRSRSFYLPDFLMLEFLRSILFLFGMVQGFSSDEISR